MHSPTLQQRPYDALVGLNVKKLAKEYVLGMPGMDERAEWLPNERRRRRRWAGVLVWYFSGLV